MSYAINLQPTLEGTRVTVRPIQPSDWESLFAAAADPGIWAAHPAKDRYTEAVFKAYFNDALESQSAFVFVDRETGKLIGSSRYHGYDADAGEIEIGWTFLTREYWGGSYNAEIKQLMLEHAFSFVDVVVFWVGEDNIRSCRAMQKIGGKQRAGTFTRDAGGQSAHVVYEIRKS